MVVLNRIYTRTGDTGETGIGDGSRLPKLDHRIVAGGSVDETNCLLGLAAASCEDAPLKELLHTIQQQLFDLGADISCPWQPDVASDRCPRTSAQHTKWLENTIDDYNRKLADLNSFVLPGGTAPSAGLHCARAVCRRAEIDVLRLQTKVAINPEVPIYLNRLSDLLFVLARTANNRGKSDILWDPDRNDVHSKSRSTQAADDTR